MPLLVPAEDIGNELVLVLGFGQPSYLEACCLLDGTIAESHLVCEEVAAMNLTQRSRSYGRLAGTHKVAIPLPGKGPSDFMKSISFPEKNFNFSLSLYCTVRDLEAQYDELAEELLIALREAGLKKANLIRSRSGPELHSDQVISRSAMDFVVFSDRGETRWGITAWTPDTERFRSRSMERPFVSSKISLSSRLARLLVNVCGLSRGQTLLDPFCGSGTILGEALLSGINCIGIDRNYGRIEQTNQNLSWLLAQTGRHASFSVLKGDATKLEEVLSNRQVDGIVTEPILLPRLSFAPSLEKAKRLIKHASQTYSEAIYSMSRVLHPGARLVIVVPSLRTSEGKDVSVTLENLEDAGLSFFEPPQHHFEYPMHIAHQSTRWIRRMVYVLERI